MDTKTLHDSPEATLHYEALTKDRAEQRQNGKQLMIFFSIITLFSLLGALLSWFNYPFLPRFLTPYAASIALISSAFIYRVGFKRYVQGKVPVSEMEIERRSRRLQAMLATREQGEHPPELSVGGALRMNIIMGIIVIAGGVIHMLFFSNGAPPWLNPFGDALVSAGIVIIAVAFWLNRIALQRVAYNERALAEWMTCTGKETSAQEKEDEEEQ